jgi:hypothetical protein
MHTILLAVLSQVSAPPMPGADGETVGWALQAAKWAFDQFHSHNAGPAVGMLLMVLVFLFSKLVEGKLPPKAIPYCAPAMGVVTSVGMNLLAVKMGATPKVMLEAVMHGLTMGAAAVGFWELLGKVVVNKVAAKLGLSAQAAAVEAALPPPPSDPPAPPAVPGA